MSGLGRGSRDLPVHWDGLPAAPQRATYQEAEPLIQPVSAPTLGRCIAASSIFLLVLSWCVLDNWNETVSGFLFQIGVAKGSQASHGKPQYFKYPLTLTFLEIFFMCIAFLGLWFLTSQNRQQEIKHAKAHICTAPWPIIVVTHLFSTFWLQSLMMPAQVMSIAVFAVTRAMEVPMVASLRKLALMQPFGGHSPHILGCVTVANFLVHYAYLKMEGCMCIWEGHGIFLNGIALYVIHFLLLAMPALNTVGQETIMAVWNIDPLLMLALQNAFASIVFVPALLLEDVQRAFEMIFRYEEVFLLVLWLCIQAFAFSLVTVLLVRYLDSFWAISLRSMRMVYWWGWQILIFTFGSDQLLSVARPQVSAWSLCMACGLGMLGYAMYTDTRFTNGYLKTGSADVAN